MNIKELFNDVLPVLEKFAPSIGAAIGGPFALAAGYAVPLLASAFDTHPSNIKQIVEKIIQDPDAAKMKLENMENEYGDWITSLMRSVNNLLKAEVNVRLEWKGENR